MNQSQGQSREASRLHLLFGTVMVGIVLSILLEEIVQLLPPHSHPLGQSESDLVVSPYGFLMALIFAMRGVLLLIFVAAFVRAVPKEGQSRSGLILLGVSAMGKLIIAFVPTDLMAPPHTIHGIIHALVALASFFCGALGILLLALSLRHVPTVRLPQRFLVGLASVTLVWSVIVSGTVIVSPQIGVWGLLERILTALFYLWILLVSLDLWRAPSLDGTKGAKDLPSHT